MRSPVLAATLAVLTVSTTALGQGVFINSGLGVNGDFLSYEGTNTYGGSIGYVHRGMVEAGFGVSRWSEDEEGLEINSTSYVPYVAVYPLRQSDNMPLSVRVGSTLAFHSFGGDAFDALDEFEFDMSGRTWTAGTQLFRGFPMSPKFSLIPTVGAEYVRSTIEIKGLDIEGDQFESTETDDGFLFRAGVSGAFSLKRRNVVNVTPAFIVSDQGDTAFGITIGVARSR